MSAIELADAQLLCGAIAFRATSALGEGTFLITRVTLEDLKGRYFEADSQMLEAFESIASRIREAAGRMIVGNLMAANGRPTTLTTAEFSEPY